MLDKNKITSLSEAKPSIYYALEYIQDELQGYFWCNPSVYESPLITLEDVAQWWSHLRQCRFQFTWMTVSGENDFVKEIYAHVYRFVYPYETVF